ncbi:hypothetical protein BJI67_16335 (plasmid) [Acidihalobacter aeolianus]|uniref:Uncharacterized protein n=1 Tax=Acidihalobacter aeolianus TaxID=2792603 RepID=A0A1D8KCW5_9GAMM|nr:hypothetical protein [Acidihalobacter aeolianus]AOV18806.1 hypothetical protein BJI67_16335 [Acidihalobacter aeolianus]
MAGKLASEPDSDIPVRLAKEALDTANALSDLLYEIDVAIHAYAKTLEDIQPQHSGKVFIRWSDGKPRAYRWERVGKTKWRAVHLPRANLARRASSRGEFADSYERVNDILSDVSFLMNRRTAVLNVLGNFQRGASSLRRAQTERITALVEKALS